ncbi:hypothetical protein Ndes2437A_g02611 [Nannochloris sp. 'desiccata']|nr:hypothetical protein KSW81_001572 [Chlorella desiccata (nom. nud.)]
MASSGQDVLKEPGPSNLRIVRVKRKRNLEAPADLVIQDLAPKKKKSNESLSDALGGLGLSASVDAPPARIRPKRYSKLTTMTAAEMLQMGPEKLQKMLTTTATNSTTEQIDPTSASIAPLDSITVPNATTTVTATKKRSGNFGNGGGERYEQIRRRRGLTNFEVTESAVDPLRGVASVHDVVRISEATDHQQQKGISGLDSRHGGNNQPLSAEENILLCNYLPMVREYLDEEEEQQQQQQHQDGTTSDDVMDTDGYVYDLYIEAEQQYPFGTTTAGTGYNNSNDTAGNGDEGIDEEDAWWEMHIRGGAPVVQIIDDDNWLVVEASDEEDTDASSEDSNAEDYYGNDYPDEEEDSEGNGTGVRGGGRFFFF